MSRTLPDWNKGRSYKQFGETPPFLLTADDAIGGFYLLNGGALGKDAGRVYYLAPHNLEYEPLDLTYTEFLLFCCNHNLDQFYEDRRWTNWRPEVAKLDGDKVFHFYPYLWTKKGKNINENLRKPIAIDEQYSFNMEMRKQLGIDK